MKIIRWLDRHLEESLLFILTTIMVSAISLQVFMRRVMGDSLTWSEELSRYCFIWLVYIGISYAVKKQRHIKIDLLLYTMKERGKLVMSLIANMLFLCFCITVIVYGSDIAMQLMAFGQTSPAMHIPMGLVYLATPIGMGLTAIRLLQNMYKQIQTLRGKESFEVKTEEDKLLERAEKE